MGVRDRRRRRNAFRPAVLCVAVVALVHLLAKNLVAALLSVAICGFPNGGNRTTDQFLLDGLTAASHAEQVQLNGVPGLRSDLPLQ